jgi:hypothetical protein
VDEPIACSLDYADARSQLDEWHTVLGTAVTATERESPTVIRMRLRADAGSVGRIAALAEREVACCPFFRFAIEIDATGLALTVTVPPDAAEVLTAFAALATA